MYEMPTRKASPCRNITVSFCSLFTGRPDHDPRECTPTDPAHVDQPHLVYPEPAAFFRIVWHRNRGPIEVMSGRARGSKGSIATLKLQPEASSARPEARARHLFLHYRQTGCQIPD